MVFFKIQLVGKVREVQLIRIATELNNVEGSVRNNDDGIAIYREIWNTGLAKDTIQTEI